MRGPRGGSDGSDAQAAQARRLPAVQSRDLGEGYVGDGLLIGGGRLAGQAVILVSVQPVVEHPGASANGRGAIAEEVVSKPQTRADSNGGLVIGGERYAVGPEHFESRSRIAGVGDEIPDERAAHGGARTRIFRYQSVTGGTNRCAIGAEGNVNPRHGRFGIEGRNEVDKRVVVIHLWGLVIEPESHIDGQPAGGFPVVLDVPLGVPIRDVERGAVVVLAVAADVAEQGIGETVVRVE